MALGWEVFPLLLLFWFENVVIGGFNVLRMLSAKPGDPLAWIARFFLIPFFVVHYGMFTAVHGAFVFALFGGGEYEFSGLVDLKVIGQALSENQVALVALALVLSHGFSFVWNYLRGGEYRETNLQKLMMQPYGRIVVLHVVVLFGGFLVLSLGSPTAGLLVLIALKVGLDVVTHVREHSGTMSAVET